MVARRHIPDLDLAGRSLAHYRVLEQLGRGGMGEVFLAEDLRLGRRVALKILFPELAAQPGRLERFEREARSVAALNHPNIVTLHSVEEADGLHFLVMELVDGQTLADLLSLRGPFPLEELLDIALALTRALEVAHARGIVHRDLKPSNVMVTSEGRVKVLDFGIASITDRDEDELAEDGEDTGLTRTGVIVGTPHYMAPEQIQGHPVDPRTDLFSLGILLFEMATGKRPFQGTNRLAVLGSILLDTPPPARSLRPDLPLRFDEILALCLSKEPFLRYRSAAKLRTDLTDLASGHGLDLGSTLVAVRPLLKRPEAVRWDRPRHSSRLPAPPRCLGREKEVGQLVEALCADPPFPVPVLGAAGAGKSTITLTALHHPRVTEQFGKRRFFVRCDGATDRDSLVAAIARLVCPDAQLPLEPKVFLELEEAPAVLALDNCETPWEQDTAAVEELLAELAAIPGLALVAALRGEQRPFGPDWRETIRADPLNLETARSVFLAFAGERFRDDPDLDPLLLELDGLALAVVLLASQAEAEPDLEGLRQRWHDQRTALLHRSGGREKLHSLEVSLQLSIDSPRMTEESLRLLSLLGLLPEGVAREDLVALLPESGADAASVLRKVGLAYDQGLRLRVLAPIREYVQRSHTPPEEDFDRTVDHYLALARIGEKLGTEGGAEAADRLRAEMGNLEPMILAGLERDDPIPAIRSALACTEAIRVTGVGGLILIGCARQAARAVSQAKLEADCIRKLGDINLYRGHLGQAWSCYEEALEIYRRAGELHGEACCTACLGDVYLQRGQPRAASRFYEEAWTHFHELGDLYWEAYCLHGLGHTGVHLSEKDARLRLEKAMTLFRQIGDVRGEANCLLNLGHGSFYLNDFERARTEYEAALPLFRRIGSLQGESSCLRSLGHIALNQGNPKAARTLAEKALLLSRRVGSLLGEANCLFILGEAARVHSEHERAEALLQEALARFQQLGQTVGMANCMESLGLNAAAQLNRTKALPLLQEALRLNQQVPRPAWIGRSHLHMAKLEHLGSVERQQHIEAARQVWEEAGILDELRHELEEALAVDAEAAERFPPSGTSKEEEPNS
jgi:serine/threonine protein kinase/tetratricopeptide (TPR) repeat protein